MQAIKQWIKKNFAGWLYRRQRTAARKQELIAHANKFAQQPVSKLADASFDVFTYHGEDGIIFYLLQKLHNVPHVFVDIGSGDGIKSNCAALAYHFGWEGVFIDRDAKQVSVGRSFYKKKITGGANLGFVIAELTNENVNDILLKTGFGKDVGLLSIDIDGNDYWIWRAIEVIRPRIIVIEAKVEFGSHDMVVPYGTHNHRSVDKMYNGASVEAFRELGMQKGYKLVGANRYGYNLFFVQNEEDLPAINTGDVLTHPDTIKSFYPESFFLGA